MADSASAQPTEETPTLTLIQHIRDGSRSANLLTKEQRQQCVVCLRTAGYSYAHLAQFLSISEKTIQRDIGEIRARNKADPPSEELAMRLIGEYLTWMDVHHASLVRFAQDKSASIEARIVAETQAARLMDARMARLQSMGYLPQQSRSINEEHHKSRQPNDEPRIVIVRYPGEETVAGSDARGGSIGASILPPDVP